VAVLASFACVRQAGNGEEADPSLANDAGIPFDFAQGRRDDRRLGASKARAREETQVFPEKTAGTQTPRKAHDKERRWRRKAATKEKEGHDVSCPYEKSGKEPRSAALGRKFLRLEQFLKSASAKAEENVAHPKLFP
jgi:hypothetical protein